MDCPGARTKEIKQTHTDSHAFAYLESGFSSVHVGQV